ncbi:hypothetical protein BDV96DRAFT_640412 [Lophiotrema nucula]|uniref:Uncharacterized protein n=1 Tax=Lophiotrema nucula TaxID=690887 RepID=A0A6A5ZRR4_9PLEO|nr:hypothetical protein BDV96DRAFT_640412 [Lophiotrema nucula]
MATVKKNPDHHRSLLDYRWAKFETCARCPNPGQNDLKYLKETLKDVVAEIPGTYSILLDQQRRRTSEAIKLVQSVSSTIHRLASTSRSMKNVVHAIEFWIYFKQDVVCSNPNLFAFTEPRQLRVVDEVDAWSTSLDVSDEQVDSILNRIRLHPANAVLGNLQTVGYFNTAVQYHILASSSTLRKSKISGIPQAYNGAGKHLLKPLRLIQEHALWEIRKKVYPTVGKILPVELAETVCE